MGTSAADGVTADLPGLQRLAAAARDRAADVRAIVTALRKLPAGDENSFGGALAAYQGFLAAWTDELGINADALDELGDKFTQAAAAYQHTDLHWATSLQQAAAPPTAAELANPGSSSTVQPGVTTPQPGVTSPQPGVTTQ